MNGRRKTMLCWISSRKVLPLGKGDGAFEFEDLAIVDMTFLIEVVVN